MMATTRAQQLRHHRKCFEYAQKRGITPREAELEMKLQAARDRAAALKARMEAKAHAEAVAPAPETTPTPIATPDERDPEPWMMRD
ncbi:MAG: hypothetical protein CMN71_10700 [Sphingomonadaceae bacterium]|nr:hypothetical protein [Sphingomonadaceae bacterium]